MENKLKNDPKAAEIDSAVGCLGMKCVEICVNHGKVSVSVSVYLMKKDRSVISTEDLDGCYNAIYPVLREKYSTKDIFLEVSSPGTERKIKDVFEFTLFRGSKVRIYDAVTSDWVCGVINDAESDRVHILSDDGKDTVCLFDNIRKASLLDEENSEVRV